MQVATYVEMSIETGAVLYREGFDYEGEFESLGGGPSAAQKQATAAQTAAATQATKQSQQDNQIQLDAYGQVKPLATGLIQNGDPYTGAKMDYAGSNTATAFAPGRADLMRRLSTIGGLPSGSATSAITAYNEGEARAHDANLGAAEDQNTQAKLAGANLLAGQQATFNPNAPAATAINANQSVINAPQKPSIWGSIAGAAGSALSGTKLW